MSDFSLTAHIMGSDLTVSARAEGTRWVVTTWSGARVANGFQAALGLARDEIGRYLSRARRGHEWGLVVRAGTVSALYGTPNPAGGVVLGGGGADPNSLLARIYRRWRDGDSPIAALDNAVEIVRAFADRPRRAAA